MSREALPLFTIGYEQATPHTLMQALVGASVRAVIDVRELPLSRRPGFSKRALAAEAQKHGMTYVHLRGLGTPKEGRIANKRRAFAEFWRIVDEKLATDEGEAALEEAAAVALRAPACLLCLEASFETCHRRRVAELLAARHGFVVTHLVPDPLPLGP